jgi:hypothetical protein
MSRMAARALRGAVRLPGSSAQNTRLVSVWAVGCPRVGAAGLFAAGSLASVGLVPRWRASSRERGEWR